MIEQSKKKRLLFLSSEYWSFESHKLEMAAAARDAGFDVAVAARVDGPYTPPTGFTLISLPWRRSSTVLGAMLRLPIEVWQVRRLLGTVNADVLHAIDLKPGIIGALAALGRKVIVLTSINGFGFVFFASSLFARLVQWACGLVLRLAEHCNAGWVLVQNRDDAAVVRRRMGIADARLRLIRGSGVDPTQFSVKPLPDNVIFRFLILSRLLYMKGVQVAVEAHEILRRRGVASELLVCGAPDPGNPSSIPQATLDRWSAIPGVVFRGHVKDIASVLAECHIVLQPALGGEGLPKSLLEAGASGRGMIASDVPGNTEIVIHGETGLLVPPNDAAALANAMQQALSSPRECERWGLAAREKVVREFSSALIRAQHAALYRDLAVKP